MSYSEKSKNWLNGRRGLLALLLGLLIVYLSFRNRQKSSSTSTTQQLSPLSERLVKTANNAVLIDFCKIVDTALRDFSDAAKKLIVSIAAHETGRYTSRLYKEQNNAFGMRCPSKRTTMSAGCANNYAVYHNVQSSIVDFELWFNQYNKSVNDFSSASEIVSFMKRKGYFEADEAKYARSVEYYYNLLK